MPEKGYIGLGVGGVWKRVRLGCKGAKPPRTTPNASCR